MPNHEILADSSISVTEFKKNPMAAIEAGDNFPIVVLNHNKPAFYCVPVEAYEILMNKLEDMELNQIADSRQGQPGVKVSIDDL